MARIGNKYLLDTCVFVDYLKKQPIARQIVFETRAPKFTCGYSIITEAELWAGMRKFDTDTQYKLILRPYNRYFINSTIAKMAGTLRRSVQEVIAGKKGESLPEITDCLIAATAQYHELIVLTRNRNHFRHFIRFSVAVEFYDLNK